MSYFAIKSKLAGHVIDIQGNSTAAGAALDAYTATNGDNQQWEFEADPSGSGFYYITSKLSGNVIEVGSANPTQGPVAGIPLDAGVKATSGNQKQRQLWQFVEDPAGSGYCFIMNQGSGQVINIKGASTTPGALLQNYPMKSSDTDNELWEVVGGSFPATVKTVSGISLGSNSNYILYSGCQPLIDLAIVIQITEDMVCESTAPPTACKPGGTSQFGFSFQLNCYSTKGFTCAYQQYVVAFWRNSSNGFNVIYGVDNWPVSGNNLINNNFPVLATLPTAVLPAGYQIVIGLINAATSPNAVEGVVFYLLDNDGKRLGDQSITIASIPGANTGDLAPITAFEMDVVGPINGEIATLSSGAGYITYGTIKQDLQVFVPTATSGFPTCTETTAGTCETANTFYGLLPSNSSLAFEQSFEVNQEKAVIQRKGTPRLSTRFFAPQTGS
jgi:hypothetical protein